MSRAVPWSPALQRGEVCFPHSFLGHLGEHLVPEMSLQLPAAIRARQLQCCPHQTGRGWRQPRPLQTPPSLWLTASRDPPSQGYF